MRLSLALLSVWLAIPVFGYSQATPTDVPKLSDTEVFALQEVSREYQAAVDNYNKFTQELAKNHPGYHTDPQRPFSGILVKDAPPKETPSVNKPVEPKAPEKK